MFASMARPRDLDPELDLVLDASRLKGIAHPLRVRLLGLLRADGPSTATRLAERVGESSASTSYHLRQLAAYGFIVPTDAPAEQVERPGSGREKWWRAAHRSTHFDTDAIGEADDVDEAGVLAGEYLRGVAALYYGNTTEWLAQRDGLPEVWRHAGTISDLILRLTPQESTRLSEQLYELITSYRDDDVDVAAPDDAERVVVQVQVLPFIGAGRRPR